MIGPHRKMGLGIKRAVPFAFGEPGRKVAILERSRLSYLIEPVAWLATAVPGSYSGLGEPQQVVCGAK